MDQNDDIFMTVQRLWDNKKTMCLIVLEEELIKIAEAIAHHACIPDSTRKMLGLPSVVDRMKTFEQSMNVLVERFKRTTNEEQGKQVFIDDVKQLVVDMKVVLEHGFGPGNDALHFPRFYATSWDGVTCTVNADDADDKASPSKLRSRKRQCRRQ